MAFTRSFSAREDSGSANNPALNLTGAAASEITFVNETSSGGPGDLFLEGGGIDPDTVLQIDGVTYSFELKITGTLPTLKRDGAQQVPDQFEGDAIYVIEVSGYPTSTDTTRFAFLPESNATLAEMDAFGNGGVDIQNVNNSPPPTAVCFAAGTLIHTDRGPRPVENLQPGDRIATLDAGYQPLLWHGMTGHIWSREPHKDKPICFAPGSLGKGVPKRALMVSPQHRMVLKCQDTGAEFMVPARLLLDLPGVRQMNGKRRMSYHHLLLPAHAVIIAEWCPAESFYPGPMAMASLHPKQVKEVVTALAAISLDTESYGGLARTCLTRAALRQHWQIQRPAQKLPLQQAA